ncbi:hypothetical protein GCM10010363_57710 [Streptomyces omiyaensis]|nr:hypothetical protein GCM10010363_57710 [Streptomyces omiyaensis]
MRAQLDEDRQEVALQTGVAGLEVDDLHAGTVAQAPAVPGGDRPGARRAREMPGPPSGADAILSS